MDEATYRQVQAFHKQNAAYAMAHFDELPPSVRTWINELPQPVPRRIIPQILAFCRENGEAATLLRLEDFRPKLIQSEYEAIAKSFTVKY